MVGLTKVSVKLEESKTANLSFYFLAEDVGESRRACSWNFLVNRKGTVFAWNLMESSALMPEAPSLPHCLGLGRRTCTTFPVTGAVETKQAQSLYFALTSMSLLQA